jgi:hypothetical protein
MVTRNKYKILEKPSGIGEVWEKDKQIAKVEYYLEVQQKILVTRSMSGTQELDGMKDTSGYISVISGERNLFGRDKRTLKMQDGRKIDFFVTRFSPTEKYIQIQPTGDFY